MTDLLYAGGLRTSSDGCQTVITGDDGVTVSLRPSAVNAANQRLEFQLSLEPSATLLSPDGYTATESISLLTFPVDGSRVVSFAQGEALASSTQSEYDAGKIEEWPFDTYRNSVSTATGTQPLPTVEITARRSASTVAFGIVLLVLMAVLPVLVLFLALRAYTGRRKVEATLTSWIGAILFAIIPLRTFLPGSPPVGSWIDYLVVLWVIVGPSQDSPSTCSPSTAGHSPRLAHGRFRLDWRSDAHGCIPLRIASWHGLSEVDDGFTIGARPLRQHDDRLLEGETQFGEAVLDPRWSLSEGLPIDETVRLQPAEGLRENLARDSADKGHEFAVPSGPFGEREKSDHRPLVGDDLNRQTRGAVGQKDGTSGDAHDLNDTNPIGTFWYLSDP